jgi:hypothetical protein
MTSVTRPDQISAKRAEHANIAGQIAQVVERWSLDREVRGSNSSHDTMALLLGQHYEFPQCGIIKEKLLLLLLIINNYYS